MTGTAREPASRQVPATREVHAIVNPTSGNGRAGRDWPALQRRLRALGLTVHPHLTTGPDDAAHIAAHLSARDAAEIVVVGGDGTLNETVNGCFAGDRDTAGPVISVLPCGTGRDFSRSIGISSTDQAIDVLLRGAVQAIDVGRIDYQAAGGARRRHFVNVADVGLGAETAAWINRTSKALGGFLAYFVGAARTIVVFHGRPARVTIDGTVAHDGPVALVVLANGRFHAGGMDMAPMASMTDGRFEVLIVRDVPKLTLLGSLLPRVYRGRHIGHPAVVHRQGSRVAVEAAERLLFECDGEQPGATDLRAVVLPRALRVRVPAGVATLRPS